MLLFGFEIVAVGVVVVYYIFKGSTQRQEIIIEDIEDNEVEVPPPYSESI